MEPIINSQVPEFKVQAFHNGEFKTVTNKDIEGKWAIFFFYPADFTFVCPTELVDIAEKYNQFKEMGVEVLDYHSLNRKKMMSRLTGCKKSAQASTQEKAAREPRHRN